MRSLFLLGVQIYVLYCPSLVDSRSLWARAVKSFEDHYPSPSLEVRQIPGVIAASEFLRRGFHASAVAGNWVYIDGGDFSWTNNGVTNYDYSSTMLSIDLSQTWTNDSVTIKSTAKPSGVPSFYKPSLWYDEKSDMLYTGFTGTKSPFDNGNDVLNYALWSFKPDGEGSGVYSELIKHDDPTWKTLSWCVDALMASGPNSAFVLGGTDPANKFSPLPGLVQFNFTTHKFSNSTATDYNAKGTVERGAAHYVPSFGPEGLFLVFSGYDFTKNVDFKTVSVYDTSTAKWYNQTTTGNVPQARIEFCTAGVASSNGTYEIFMYAGWTGNLGGESVPYDTVYILTLPAFHWIQVGYNPQSPRHGLSCNAVGGSQILTIGGVDSNPSLTTGVDSDITRSTFNSSTDPFVQGLAIFDMSTLQFATQYTARAPPYVQSDVVQRYYTNPATPNITPGLDRLLKVTNFTNTSTNTSGTNSPTPFPSIATSTPTPNPGPNIGAIAGGAVGGTAGLALIGALLFFLWRRRRAQGQKYIAANVASEEHASDDFYRPQKQGDGLQEMYQDQKHESQEMYQPPSELMTEQEGHTQPAELS